MLRLGQGIALRGKRKYGKEKGKNKLLEAVEKSAELDCDHEFYLVVRNFSACHYNFLFRRLVKFIRYTGVRVLSCAVFVHDFYYRCIFRADV